MLNKWRVYIKPFDDLGNYLDWVEVSQDVIWGQIGSINSDLDNTDYNIGVYRFSNFNVTLRNDHARYSDVTYPDSIFRYKRGGSLMKITWEIEPEGPFVGIASSESGYLSEEVEIFQGLINDDSLSMDLSKQTIQFTLMGRDYLFQTTIVPFTTVHNGDLYSQVIYEILNQSAITSLLTVSQANIVCGLDLAIDSIASLQNQTVQQGLNNLLLISNSVLYIENSTVYVSPRTPTANVIFNFYGQTSSNGSENIIDVQGIKNGMQRLFNYFTWKNTTLFSQSASSVTKYGAQKKEISADFVTDATKQQSILDELCGQFSVLKQEFSIIVPISYPALDTGLLSKVSIDYPIVYVSTGDPVPICGSAICGDIVLPKALSSFQISSTDYYSVIGVAVNPQNSTMTFKLREI